MAVGGISCALIVLGWAACASQPAKPRDAAQVSALYAELQVHEERLARALATLRDAAPNVYLPEPYAEVLSAVDAICATAARIREQDAESRCQMARSRAQRARHAEAPDEHPLDPQG